MIIRQRFLNCFHRTFRFSLCHHRLKSTHRTNPLGIQMLSSKLHEQLFSSVGEPTYIKENVEKSKDHLHQFNLGSNESETFDDIEFDLPPLENNDIDKHFEIIARQQSRPYVDLINQLISAEIPSQPLKWNYTYGWTKFVSIDIGNISNFCFRKIFK